MNKPKISIILVSYNTKELTIQTINSIYGKTIDIDFEIIVVDNNSHDGTVSKIKETFQDRVIVVENPNNSGFGIGNNIGSEIAQGKYLFFLNSDTLLISNAVFYLFDTLNSEKNRHVGICCGNLFKEDLTPNYSYSQNLPSLLSVLKYRSRLSIGKDTFNNTGTIKDVANVIGADLFVSKKVFFDIGCFDKNFFMYVEDSELSYRVYKNKMRAISVPAAEIIHLQGKSSLTDFKIRNEIDGYCFFFKKHKNLFELFLYLKIELVFCILRIILNFILLRFEVTYMYMKTFTYLIKKYRYYFI